MPPVETIAIIAVCVAVMAASSALVGYLTAKAQIKCNERLAEAAEPPIPEETKQDLVTVNDWMAENPWYFLNQIYAVEAQYLHMQRQTTNFGEPLVENLRYVAEEMRRRHPDIRPN